MIEKRTYDANDFARYYSGKMLPKEMHELEKAALEDPMLEDALEGYQYAKYPIEETKALQSKILEKISEKKLGFPFWKIAAAVILFLGAAFWFVESNLKEEPQLAGRGPVQEEQAPAAVFHNDTTADVPLVATAPPSQNDVPQSARARTLPEMADRIEETKLRTDTPQVAVMAQIADSLSNDMLAQVGPPEDTVVPVAPMATFLRENAPAAPAAKRRALFRNIDTATEFRKLLELPDSEHFAIDNPLPEPEGGWKNFDRYLAENKSKRKQKGRVTLEFTISLTGHPTNIVVVRSTCGACERAAIVLVRDGPKWKNSPDGKGEVTILFDETR